MGATATSAKANVKMVSVPGTGGRAVVIAAMVGLVGLMVCLSAAKADAMQLSPQQKNEMKLHYDKATRAYDVGKYPEAIEEYQKAYEIGGDAAMIYNIAQAYRLSDQLSEAIRFYRRYLQRSPSAPNRDVVERRIAELEKVVDERKKSGGTYPTATPVPTTTPTPTPTTTGPTTTPVTPVTPVPPPVVTTPTPTPTPVVPFPAEPPPRASRARLVSGLVVLGVGAALGGLAIWQGKLAQSKADKLTSQSQMNGRISFVPAVETNGKNANTFAILLGSFSGAALITGGILALTAPSWGASSSDTGARPPATSLSPVIGMGLVGAEASFSF